MNKTDSRKIKHYFREIRLLIPVSSKGVKKFLQDFRSSVEEYAENHPECSAEEIIERFGSPEDVAYEYVSSVDAEEIDVYKRQTYMKQIAQKKQLSIPRKELHQNSEKLV